MSRTYQYRKVMKPMLERKRRARINKCLDELKDLMVGALQNEGESITKLEKADVLELTVRHLRKLKQHHALAIPAQTFSIQSLRNNSLSQEDKFREGFSRCASEVSRCLASIPGVDVTLGTKLMTRLGVTLTHLERRTPLTILVPSPEPSPAPSSSSSSSGYSSSYSDLSPSSSRSSSPMDASTKPMWRPW
ncbi:UNVERIFIED_CONTAM: hypothetical protein GTU68_005820 [Idotea baltica]|nr:hypothetical protein [Idotea baltica]